MFFYDIDKLCLDKITVNTILWHGKPFPSAARS